MLRRDQVFFEEIEVPQDNVIEPREILVRQATQAEDLLFVLEEFDEDTFADVEPMLTTK